MADFENTVTEETTALAEVRESQGMIVDMSNFGDNVSKTVVYNAFNAALSLAKEAPETIALAGIIFTDGVAAVTKQPCINTYLIDRDGQAYFTQSAGIARSAKQILDIWGKDVDGLVVRIIEQPFGEGRTMKRLQVLD